jgi:hypothetical protein
MVPANGRFDAKVRVLMEVFREHARDSEALLLPELRQRLDDITKLAVAAAALWPGADGVLLLASHQAATWTRLPPTHAQQRSVSSPPSTSPSRAPAQPRSPSPPDERPCSSVRSLGDWSPSG